MAPRALTPFRIISTTRLQTTLSRLLYLDTKTYLPGDILTKVDRMSMAASLEVRAPILDHHVVEWAARLPEDQNSETGRGKYLLKKLAAAWAFLKRFSIGLNRDFALPLVHWMRGELKDELLPILVEPRTLGRGYFKPKAIRGLIEEHRRGRGPFCSDLDALDV